MLSSTQVQATLDRLQYSGPRRTSLETLAAFQQAFLLTVPFENLDIHWGRPIRLGADAAFRKIVGENRGGYCYELNGLFAALLETLGFRVTLLSARMFKDGQPGLEFGHLVLRVDLAQPWLVDVGNGQSFRQPLPLDGTVVGEAEGRRFRVQSSGDDYYLMEWGDGEEAQPRFLFDLTPRSIEDFSAANEFHQTSPLSHFTKHPMCTLALPRGRATLVGNRLKLRRGNETEESEVAPVDYAACLRKWFGITRVSS